MNRIIKNKLLVLSVLFAAAFVVVVVSGVVFAQSAPANGSMNQGNPNQVPPGVFGKVTSISGSVITITGMRDSTSYAIDASNATIIKNGSTGSLADIVVGDMIMAQGTVNGSSVTATIISDGFGGNGRGGFPGGGAMPSGTPPVSRAVASGTMRSGSQGAGIPKSGEKAGVFNSTSGTPPFATGTLRAENGSSSAAYPRMMPSSTQNVGGNISSSSQSNGGFLGSIVGFFKNIFSFFKL